MMLVAPHNISRWALAHGSVRLDAHEHALSADLLEQNLTDEANRTLTRAG